mmetsp:Transcript_26611/g.25480  ORF Transcript_26611/g.25480 Transcript_26611/m.25480 type:complete len:244 (-) Transcript_26611:252-983(-)
MTSRQSEQCSNNDSNNSIHKTKDDECVIVIIFGRPGAGKSTIANETKINFHDERQENNNELLSLLLNLDLDICIPTWMKENFGKGIYPTLSERHDFAIHACNYVEKEIQRSKQAQNNNNPSLSLFALLSFSFVNNDLREVFRTRFPNAIWMLLDVMDQTAQERIETRSGHFYNGNNKKTKTSSKEPKNHSKELVSKKSDNSEWEFAPVLFPHIILNGSSSVKVNAEIVAKTLINSTNNSKIKH